MKTIKRNWLKKQIEDGKVEAKCDYSMTDDYAFDNANCFGATGFAKARISRPTFKTITLPNGAEREVLEDSDTIDGAMNFKEYEFTGKSGAAYKTDDGLIRLRVHSNLVYTLRMV